MRMRVSVASLCVGVALVCAGIAWMAPEYVMSALNADVAASAKSEPEGDAPGDEAAEEAAGTSVVSETDRAADGIDWADLQADNAQVRSWIEVPNKGIDFPVLHGSDNEYYLHHDMYGRWGYAGVFTDHRCDPNGRNVIVYGHTLIGGGMFTQLGVADEPGQLATIGDVFYSTPEAGTVKFKPVATLHVYPTFQDAQRFSWDVTDEQMEAARRAVAKDKAASGEWNVELPAGESPAGEFLVDYYPTSGGEVELVEAEGSEPVEVERYYAATASDDDEARERAEKSAWRDWLVSLCEQGTQVSGTAAADIASASRSLVLACCSWPFDSHRTLVVCVA